MKYAQLVTRSKHTGKEIISNVLDEFTAKTLYNHNIKEYGNDFTFELRKVEEPTKEQLEKLQDILSQEQKGIDIINNKLPEFNSEQRVKYNLGDDKYWTHAKEVTKIMKSIVDVQLLK